MLFFIAIVAPPEIDGQVLQWKRWMNERYGCKVALKSPAHITLVPPFNMETESEANLRQPLEAFAREATVFSILMNGFGAFGRRVIFVQVDKNPQLGQLHEQLQQVMQDRLPGLTQRDTRPFHPHMTIATRDIPPRAFQEAMTYFKSIHYTAAMPVNRLSLLRLAPGKWEIVRDWAFGTA